MKETNKTLKIVLSILVVVLISLISFGGIFVKDKNRMKNVLPEYQMGMDFSGKRVFSIKPDETINKEYYDKDGNKVESSSIEEGKEDEYEVKEIPVNSEEILTKDNFNKTKEIIEKRLRILDVKEYEVRLNEENGEIYVAIPENKYTDTIISQMTTGGDFKITDSANEENVLIPGEQIKDVKVGIGTQGTSKVVFLNIQFDKEGTKKLQEISKTYTGEESSTENTKTVEESAENSENEATNKENIDETSENNTEDSSKEETQSSTDNTTSKKVNLVLDGENLLTTYFSEEIKDGVLQLSMGSSNTSATEEELQNYLTQASNLAVLLKTEKLPITYTADTNLYMQSNYNSEVVRNFSIIAIVIFAILVIYAVVKYKKEGILLMISQIGFIALLLIIIRYTNVVITLTGFFAIAVSAIMSYIFIMRILKLKETEEKAFHKATFEFLTIYAPALIISVVFSFSSYLPIASFGMIMFYAVMLMIIYHGIITRSISLNFKNK